MKKILLIDDSTTILNALQQKIENSLEDVEILLAHSLQETNQQIRHNQKEIAVAVVDLHLPDCEVGKAVLLTNSNNIPTIILTGTQDSSLKELLLKKNVLDYIHKDDKCSINYAIDFVQKILRNYNRTVLVVDDSRLFRQTFRNDLEKLKLNVIEANDGQEAIDIMESQEGENVNVVLTDYNMPNVDGIELTKRLRHIRDKDSLSIIAISSTEDEFALTDFIKAGANDFLRKPHRFEELTVRINANLDTLDLFQKAKDLANKDFLTGAYNRRYFFEASSAIVDKNRRKDKSIAVATIDIDKFKNINDTYGHDIGDIAIKEIVTVLNKTLRSSDLMARFGGEEFCLLLEDISYEDATKLFEKIRHNFESNIITLSEITLNYTVSIGVAYAKSADIDTMLKISDEALYEAKESGRNKVIFHQK